ncbi:MAG: hemerythrin domain-containing protein [Gammaproteobacteria bacterium]|nr:MAG: hemerythrin domain-containing protein [Gammaproteobacteria bacterium]
MNDSLISELPGLDDPLGVLRACHERMLAQCDTLQGLVPHIAQNGLDDEARNAIGSVIHYFATSAVHHHQDEEQDLFPLLNRQSLKLAEIIYRLKQEHELLTRLWEQLLQDLNRPAALAENSDFESRVEQFCSAYREHIDYENKELLGMAQHILSQRQLEDMGRTMARRRGVRRPCL